MGAVTAEVVIATFFNFHPALVRRSIPNGVGAGQPGGDPRLPGSRRRRRCCAAGSATNLDAAELGRARRLTAGRDALRPRKVARSFAGHARPGLARREPHLVAVARVRPCCASSAATATSRAQPRGVSGCEALVLARRLRRRAGRRCCGCAGLDRRRVGGQRRGPRAPWLGSTPTARSPTPAGHTRPGRGAHRRARRRAVGLDRRRGVRPPAIGRSELSRAIVAGGTFTPRPDLHLTFHRTRGFAGAARAS